MLKVKKLDPRAKLPTVAHPGEDLAYDLYALEDVVLPLNETTSVRTGIAAQAYEPDLATFLLRQSDYAGLNFRLTPLGLLIRDRSSMAAKGLVVSGGVVDAGYTGEITVRLTNTSESNNEIYLYKYFDELRLLNARQGQLIETEPGEHIVTKAQYLIRAGDKIAQMIPIPVLTGEVIEVTELRESARGEKGFGSSGK